MKSLVVGSPFVLAGLLGVSSSLSAQTTLGHWQFEDTESFLKNTTTGTASGTAGTGPTHYELPASGAGSAFPVPVGSMTNAYGASFTGDGRMLAADVTKGMLSVSNTNREATFEAFFNADSVSGLQGLGGIWASSGYRSFYLGISEGFMTAGLTYGSASMTQTSTLEVTAGRDYYAAIIFTGNATADAIFYLQDLTAGGAMQSATVSFDPTESVSASTFSNQNSASGFTIGGISGGSFFNGIIDEVRLTRGVLDESSLLVSATIPEPGAAALLVGVGVLGLVASRRRRA